MAARSAQLIVTALATVLVLCGSTARAGSYDVVACDAAGGANNSWAPVIGNSLAVTAYTLCPTGGDSARGMIARNVVEANSAASGNVVAQMKFTAAPGTTIVGLSAAYDFFRDDPQWEAALSTGSVVLRGCPIGGPPGCTISNAGEWIDVPGGSQVIYIDAYCATSGCPLSGGDPAHNYLSARARLISASVRLQDDSAPAINSVLGALWTDGWKSGSPPLIADVADNAGVRQTALLVDDRVAIANNHPCDSTLVVPCPNSADSLSFLTAGWPDGAHKLTVQAVDSAGNVNSVSRTALLDNSPPGPPQGLTLDGGEGWRSPNSFNLHWSNPTQAAAPLSSVQWQLCPAAGTGVCVAGQKDGTNVWTKAVTWQYRFARRARAGSRGVRAAGSRRRWVTFRGPAPAGAAWRPRSRPSTAR